MNRNFDTIFYAAGALTNTSVLQSTWSTTEIGYSDLQSTRGLRRVRTQVSHNIIDRIYLSTFLPTSPLQHVRIHTELLRLLELYGPSHALYQNLYRGQCKEKVLQSSSRALHRGFGHLQYMSIARASATPCTNEKDVEKSGERLLGHSVHKGCKRPKSAETMPVTLMPGLGAILSFQMLAKGMRKGSLDFDGQTFTHERVLRRNVRAARPWWS